MLASIVMLGGLALSSPTMSGESEEPLIELVDPDGLHATIKAHKGKVLVLNFWATWCEPCREEFPDLVRFASENAGKVELMTVSLDDPDLIDSDVKPFIMKMKAPGKALVKGPGDPDTFITSVDPSWSGVLPSTFIYDVDGSQAHAVHGQIDYARLNSMVKPMLAAAK
jgi:thiol-disulfide isomerase/thioredoxin